MSQHRISFWGLSEVGLVRHRNEDYWEAVADRQFVAMADGMGGHLGGDIAAEHAVVTLCTFVREQVADKVEPITATAMRLRRGIDHANEAVFVLARSDRSLRGMGSTLACLQLVGSEIIYAHVGDSRIYRLRQQELVRLTSDHSLVTELLESGHISQEEADRFIYRHVITRAVGTRSRVEPDIAHEPAQQGDLYLLCSDGVTDLLPDAEIRDCLLAADDLKGRGAALRERVIQKGASDNFTIVLVQIDE